MSEFTDEKVAERKAARAERAEKIQATKKLLLEWSKETVEVTVPTDDDKDLAFVVRARLGKSEAEKFRPVYASISPLGFLIQKEKNKGIFNSFRRRRDDRRLEELIQEFCNYIVVEPKLGIDYWKKAPDELGALIIGAHLRASSSVFANIDDIKPFRPELRGKSPKRNV
jgi:hypothetical protein